MGYNLTYKIDALCSIKAVLSTNETEKEYMKIQLDLIREILEEAEKLRYENIHEKIRYENIKKIEKEV